MEHFKEPSDGCLALSMCFWGHTHMYEINSAFKHYSSMCRWFSKQSFTLKRGVFVLFPLYM